MDYLKQIIQVVKNIKLKASDLIIVGQKADSKVYTFYEKILNGDFQTDEEAAHFFYKSDINHSSYKNLKSTLRTRMVNTLFFIKESSDFSPRENAFFYCSRYLAAARMLHSLNFRQVAVDLFHRVLKKSLHFEFTAYTIEACNTLRSHYTIRSGDQSKFDYYNNLLKKTFKVREAEFLADEYYLKILMPYIKDKSVKEETHQQATEAYKALAPYLKDYDSPFLHYMTYYIESLQYLVINDYLSTIEVCKKAVAFFEQKDYVYKTALKAFFHQLVLCYTQLKIYEEGKELIEKSNALLREGNFHWYINLELYLTLAIHSEKYQEAYYIFNRAVNHKKFKQQEQRVKEKWQILQAYVYLLIQTEQIRPIRDDKNFSNFRMGKFLNSVPTFSKDKRGLNIPILVIQIVLMIIKKDYSKAIDRIEAIDKYRARYLRRDVNFRSNCFIKMLLQIPISGFHKAGIIRKTEKLFTQLKTVPLEIAKQSNEIEIIPYENMWAIILNALGTTFYKK